MASVSITLYPSLLFICSILVSCNTTKAQNPILENSDLSVSIILDVEEEQSQNLKGAIIDLKKSLSYYKNISLTDSKDDSNFMIILKAGQSFDNFNNKECYSILSNQNGLNIEGQSNLALINGIYAYLKLLGFHWYFPGDAWHAKPRSDIFKIQHWNISNTCPAFLERKLFYTYSLQKEKQILSDFNIWQRRNRMNGMYKSNSGHSYSNIVPKTLFAEKPEWFALLNGKRSRRGQLCLSNQALQNHAKKWIKEFIKQRPILDIISVSPNDGDRWCTCQNCSDLGNKTDRAVFFANLLGEEIEQEYPDKYIRLNAYLGTAEPGTRTANENVIIYIATMYSKYKLNELIELWNTKGENFGIREYHNNGVGPTDLPQDKINHYQAQILTANKYNFWAYHTQAGDQWIPSGLDYYLSSKLFWEPDIKIQEEKEVFFTNLFGEANHIMNEYYSLYKGSKILNIETIQKMAILIERASNLNLPENINTRIQCYKLYLVWLNKFYRLQKLPVEEQITQSKECLDLIWRSRNMHVFHAAGHFKRYDKYYPVLKHLDKKDVNLIKKQTSNNGSINQNEINALFNAISQNAISHRRSSLKNSTDVKINSKRRFAPNGPVFRRNNTFLFIKDELNHNIRLTTKDIRGGIISIKVKAVSQVDQEVLIQKDFDNSSQNILVDLSHLQNGIYQIAIEANWLSYRLKSIDNIFWLLSSNAQGAFEKPLNGYLLNNRKLKSLKVHLKSRQKSRPVIQLNDKSGRVIFSGQDATRLGHTYNIPLDNSVGEIINFRVDKNALINNIFLSDIVPVLSFDGDFEILKPFLSDISNMGN